MHVETHDKLGDLKQFQCSRIVIRDNLGNPIAVALQQSPEHIFIIHAAEEGFAQALANMGIKNTTLVHRVDGGALPKPPGELWTPQC